MQTSPSHSPEQRDPLTGMRVYHALASHQWHFQSETAYVVLADVDDFHLVNEQLGYQAGDELLHVVALTIAERFGDESTFRSGSDEFIIICNPASPENLESELDELNEALRDLRTNSLHRAVTCSFGYTYGTFAHASELHDAIRIADRQMFAAKRQGKACAAGIPFKTLNHSQRAQENEYHSYEMDKLTQLANISHYRVQSRELIQQSSCDERLAVVHFNVENFKGYNEKFGFSTGDDLLMLIGTAIARAFPDCPATRSNADQFLVTTTEEHAVEGILTVRSIFRSHIKNSSIWLKAGLYVIDDHTTDFGIVCDRAKLACDTIKGRRDIFYRIYDDELKRQIETRRYVLDHFDEALEMGYIKVYYQPIVHVATGEVCDEEALARWEDPARGLIYPDEFIPVLEETRLIHRLDLYIVRRSCENMRRRLKRGTVKDVPAVSVNLSRLDFELCDIVTEIEKILVYYDVPREYVSVEVTESALTGNQEFLKGEIDRFRADGFEVWMDDFGSGYSSLNLLKEYTFDLVKLDMGFLRGFEANDNSRILLANVINLVKELGIKTLVEGVETDDQLQFLKGVGCGKAQGYLFAKPQSLQMVMRAIAMGTYPAIEPVKERDFYSSLARVNLMRPVPTTSATGHYVTSDVAAAILLKRNNRWSCLNATEVFREYWQSIYGKTIEEIATLLNEEDGKSHARIEGALSAALVSGDWEGFTVLANGRDCLMRIKVIATDPNVNSTALLAIAS